MPIQPINPDQALTLNGVPVTGRMLAEARQQLSHEGVHNPEWHELSNHDREMAALAAGSYLRALSRLLEPTEQACRAKAEDHPDDPCDDDPRELLTEIYGAPPEDEQVNAIIQGERRSAEFT